MKQDAIEPSRATAALLPVEMTPAEPGQLPILNPSLEVTAANGRAVIQKPPNPTDVIPGSDLDALAKVPGADGSPAIQVSTSKYLESR